MMVSLQTGRNDVLMAKVKLVSPSGVQFHCRDASIDDESKFFTVHLGSVIACSFCHDVAVQAALEEADDAIMLRNVGKRQVVTVTVPHSDASSYQTLVSAA